MSKVLKVFLVFSFGFLLLLGFFGVEANSEDQTISKEELYSGIILEEVDYEETKQSDGKIISYRQVLKVQLDDKEQTVIDIESNTNTNTSLYRKNDKVIVTKTIVSSQENEKNGEQSQIKNLYRIDDYDRRNGLIFLFVTFIIISVLVARKKGFMSIISLFISFMIIFYLLVPSIIAGWNPVLITLANSILIILVNYYFSHGVNIKTTVAAFSTFSSLIFSIFISIFFIQYLKLNGLGSEDAFFINQLYQDSLKTNLILIAAVIIGLVGVLDDVTVSQTSVVFQLFKANKKLELFDLYNRSMEVGKDHIASLVNTLILVYTSSALPLLILLVSQVSTDNNSSLNIIGYLNNQIFAEEIAIMILSSIGLIIAVPISTFAAVFTVKTFSKQILKSMKDDNSHGHHHDHAH